ncbi:MAG: site-specific integrase [Mesorhizobium sp.]|uniref:tyrosine-type recombinase/integrase n=1 Tax=Mesorhizobium sp. TaxID=1871066 RepID=UPI000FEAA9DB|nr:tyrosine-type recombinase/integrase [Mesorhizobium sp.]RWH76857.1 MAG: site-specific integrase [Mesorhizobium sp.]RWH80166.1 MAG: site-specific integrase [Mesorhizobium sp.]RWH88755.1 MAG: site-specific integrase [Mesorhizobium sp.]RWH95612.1 MAG: site-specific integrase [Mesorhizobium sp.]RWI01297.1 MAG: site-specific integrase [Mesorhizobium sp.]
MATIRSARKKDGTPYWRAVWFETVRGKRCQKTKSFAKRSNAKAHAAKMETEVERRGVGDPEKHTVGRFFTRWIATLKQRGELSTTTLAGYQEKLAMLAAYVGDLRLDKLATRDLDEAYAKLLESGGKARRKNRDGSRDPRPLAPRTVLHVHRAAHTCLEQARRWKLIPDNPARDAKPPSPNKSKARAFTSDEIGRILHAVRSAKENGKETYPDLDLVVMVLLSSGLRRSELLGLALDAVDFEAGTITVKRSVVYDLDRKPLLRDNIVKSDDSYRIVTLDAAVMDRLRARKAWIAEQKLAWGKSYFDGPPLVFPGPGGFPYDPHSMTLRLRQVLRQAKVNGQPAHGHRHSMATHLIAQGYDVKTVSSRLGHSSVAITLDLYAHAVDGRDRAAGEAMGSLIKSATQVQQNSGKGPKSAA